MSEITPVQTHALGVTTFAKTENIEIELPDLQAPGCQKPAKCQDAINFSRPMRKHLFKRQSWFQVDPDPQTRQRLDGNPTGSPQAPQQLT